MELIYVCSRLKSDDEHSLKFNQAVAETMCKLIFTESKGTAFPIAPHLYMPHFLDDDKEYERAFACDIGIKTLMKCKKMSVVIVDGIISGGMLAEIYAAQQADIPIEYRWFTKDDMEAFIKYR